MHRFFLFITALVTAPLVGIAQDEALPQPVQAENFAAIKASSPFDRSLNMSDALILTGIAKMGDRAVATILNKETKETFVVSEQPNPQGWKMTGYKDDPDLEKVTATVTLAGAETVTIRYDEARIKPGESRPGGGDGTRVEEGRRGTKGKGMRGGGPPPEVMEKLRAMTDEQRNKMRELMSKYRDKMGEMSSEERSKVFQQAYEKATKK